MLTIVTHRQTHIETDKPICRGKTTNLPKNKGMSEHCLLPLLFGTMTDHDLLDDFVETFRVFELNLGTALVEVKQLPGHADMILQALVQASQLLVQLVSNFCSQWTKHPVRIIMSG